MVLRGTGDEQDAEEDGDDRERDEEVPHAHGRNVVGAAVGSLPLRVGRTRLRDGAHVDRDHAGGAPRALRRAARARAPARRSPASCSSTRTTSSTTPASRSCRRSGRSRSSSAPTGRARSSCRASRSSTRRRSRRSTGSSTTSSTRATRARRTSSRRRSPTWGSPGTIGADQDGYPWILGYRGPDALRALGRDGRPRRRADRGADGDQVRGRGRAHPRERALGEPRAPAPPALHACRRHRDGGVAARERRGDVRDARRDRRDLPRAELRSRAARTPATAARSAATRRSRTHSPGTSCSRRATCSSRARARRSGATSRSSSGRCSSASRHRSRSGCSRTWSRSRTSPSTRSGPGARCSDVDRAVRAYFDEHDLWPHWRHHTGPRDRPALPRGPVPRLGRRHGDPPGDGVHGRAGPLLARARRLPPLGHRARDGATGSRS